jgi:hypothetical protein
VIATALLFYALTVAGLLRLRGPGSGGVVVPVLYIALATAICVDLLVVKPEYRGRDSCSSLSASPSTSCADDATAETAAKRSSHSTANGWTRHATAARFEISSCFASTSCGEIARASADSVGEQD